jgi:hypothetical protein
MTSLGEHAALTIATTAYVALLVVYLGVAAFNDHIEVSVGAIASALLQGQPPYHGATGVASYELPYGPNVFLVLAGSISLFGKSIFALKLPCFLACIASGALVFAVLRRRVSARCASGAWLLFLLYLVYYDESAYWCRPEPFLLVGSALGLWLVRARPLRSAWMDVVAHAAIVAWMVGLKVTGIFYVAPTLVLLARWRGLGAACLAATIGGALSMAVFASSPFSLHAYAAVLHRTARHGLAVRELLMGASAAFFLLCPVAVARWLHPGGAPVLPARPRWPVPYRTLLLCVAAACVVAAKPGAGCHHILPFLPLGIDAFADAADGAERDRVSASSARIATLVGRASFAAIVAVCAVANVFFVGERVARAGARSREVRAILSEYDGSEIQMGYSTDAAYRDTFERILIAFDQPLYLDAGSQMDSTAAGYDATQMLGASQAACHPRIWLLPHGEPFSLRSPYRPLTEDARTVFDARFRADFAARYVKVESTFSYDVYACVATARPRP